MTIAIPANRVDVRSIPPRERHPLIFSTFQALSDGTSMELVNDHDPKPLFHQFQADLPGRFDWQYLEQGPQTWRVQITRLAAVHGASSCCGGCGG